MKIPPSSSLTSSGINAPANPLEDSLEEIRDSRAALDEHALVAITDPQGKIASFNDRLSLKKSPALQALTC